MLAQLDTTDIMTGDKQLAKELDYDLRQYNIEKTRKKRMSLMAFSPAATRQGLAVPVASPMVRHVAASPIRYLPPVVGTLSSHDHVLTICCFSFQADLLSVCHLPRLRHCPLPRHMARLYLCPSFGPPSLRPSVRLTLANYCSFSF
jgi:hypothetical protein